MAFSLFGWKRKDGEEKGEMSFVEHLEVLRGHLFRAALAIAVGAIVFAIYKDFFVKKVLMGPTHASFPTYKLLCMMGHAIGAGDAMCMNDINVPMQSTTMSGQFSMFFTLIFVGGIIIAFPYVFWEFWKFVKPALTNKELSRTRGVIFWVSLLFFAGVGFGYFVIAPYTINFFATFQLDENIENRFTITSYIDTVVPLILGTGLAFQLPLVMFFLAKVGVMSPSFLRRNRKYAIVVILILAGIITPPDVISQVICTIPLFLLYEISIWLTVKVERQKALEEKEEWS